MLNLTQTALMTQIFDLFGLMSNRIFCIDERLGNLEVWNQTKEYSGITKSFFQQYYAGKDKGVALKIKECKQYKEAVDPTTVIANFKVPQSFIYV